MNRSLIIPALLLALAASPLAAEEMNISDLPAERPADTTPKLAYGQVIRYGERVMFAPCRDQSLIQLEDVSADRSVLAALDSLGLAGGRKLYVELFGYVEGTALRVSRLNLAHADGRCQVPGSAGEAWRASGNEPGWILAAGAEWVQVKRLGQPEVAFPARPFTQENGVASFAAQHEGHSLQVRFERKSCRDSMAEAAFAWTATVTLDGRVFQGCAWQR